VAYNDMDGDIDLEAQHKISAFEPELYLRSLLYLISMVLPIESKLAAGRSAIRILISPTLIRQLYAS